MVVSTETHGDFREDDMDHSEAVNYEGIDSKAGVQAKTDEKTCENCPPVNATMFDRYLPFSCPLKYFRY